MSYLPDTNFWVEILRGRKEKAKLWLARIPPGEIFMSAVVAAELYAGAWKTVEREKNHQEVHELVDQYSPLPFGLLEAEKYGEIRAILEARGQTIGPYDLQIAATGVVHGLIIVTKNMGEFSRVPNLQCKDWEM